MTIHSDTLNKLIIPISYTVLIAKLAATDTVSSSQLLAEMDVEANANPNGRVSLLQIGALLQRVLAMTGNDALGYQAGLETGLTSHGFVGYGLMSAADLKAALNFGNSYIQLRIPFLSMRHFEEGEEYVVELEPTVQMGLVHAMTIDLVMLGLWRLGQQLIGPDEPFTLCFDYPEPPYYARYQHRLPQVRFSQPAIQLRFSAALLRRSLQTADSTTAQLVEKQCEEEMIQLGLTDNFLDHVKAEMRTSAAECLDQSSLAQRLNLSPRTLNRRLHELGTSYRVLLTEQRMENAKRLLHDPRISIASVAEQTGYSNPVNFTRAFRRSIGIAPSTYRQQISS
ncbi:MAG: AraC family transcriptional regulator [Paraperlucidibaca sp.]